MILLENLTKKRLRGASPASKKRCLSSSKARFDTQYFIEERLNRGVCGTVYKASHVENPEKKVAVKVVDRTRLSAEDRLDVLREVSIMRELIGHQGLTQLEDFFVTDTHFYIVQPLGAGGDLFDRLSDHGAYDEKDAQKLAYKLLIMVQDFHEVGLVHRDLKPENILLEKKADDTSILIGDWGFADRLASGKFLSRWCGTPDWIAPEILLQKPYRTSVDMWSIGCIIYATLCGYPPFYSKDHKERFRKITAGDFKFRPKHWAGISEEAKELIKGLLTLDPQERWTVEDALQSAWFKGFEAIQNESSELRQ